MDGRRQAMAERTIGLGRVPEIPPSATADAGQLRSPQRLRGWQMVTFLFLWVAVLFVASAIEPPPAHPDAAPALGALLGTLFVVGMVATVILALTRSRSRTATASVFTGVAAVAMTVACPVVGHHHLAPWWFGELLLVTAPTAWSYRQLRLSHPGRMGE